MDRKLIPIRRNRDTIALSACMILFDFEKTITMQGNVPLLHGSAGDSHSYTQAL